ncbi:MAG TPA: acyltransferase family protein [Terriglobia bacterium]|nr:acyltransferase family protein [Terriglobia bacterium]
MPDFRRAKSGAADRRYELDWLRCAAVLIVFLYHAARIFNAQYWDIRNTQRSFAVDVVAGFVGLWLVPLFFLVAGGATRFTLDRHSPAEYVRRRFKRLMLPFIAGVVVLSPIQALLLSSASHKGPYLSFYIEFFSSRLRSAEWSLAWLFGEFGFHLWFLGFLFVYSVLALPVFTLLRITRTGQDLIDALARRCSSACGLLLWAVPLAIVQGALRAGFPKYLGLADFLFWFLFFVYGYLLYSDPRFLESLVEQRRGILAAAAICFLALALFRSVGLLADWQRSPGYSAGFILFQVLWGLDAWAWLLYILGLGARFLNLGNPTIRYATEAVLPFYVLHQPVIVAVAATALEWNLGLVVKWVVVSVLSMALTLATYEGVVRRTRMTRWAFGMG